MNTRALTVSDVLQRKPFSSATVIAGEKGLHRIVRWSHIVEVEDFESLVNGGEIILTTGAGLKLGAHTQHTFVKKLIEHQTAGLFIELGTHLNEVPPLVLELANKYDFPIIVFNEIVKFVDITQDLHTTIINKHYERLAKLDELSKKFSEYSLGSNGILKILQELHDFFKQNTFFISNNLKPFYFPSSNKEAEIVLRTYLNQKSEPYTEQQHITVNDQSFALMPVTGLGQIWGYLCLQVQDTISDEFPFLLLDRAAVAITQILLRNRTIEERKQNLEVEFVRNLLRGESYDQQEAKNYLPAPNPNLYYRIVIIETNVAETSLDEDSWEEIKLQRTMMVRSLFERYGFFPAIAAGRSKVLVIASFIALENEENVARFTQIINAIKEIKGSSVLNGEHCTFGVSMIYQQIDDAKIGYVEATEVIKLYETTITKTHFYENLGIYRLLPLLDESTQLQRYVDDYLTPIIDHDLKTGNDLLTTLTVFLACGGVIKTASDQLFIVRQTLYHRLERLKTILGDDFMEPTNRLALEVAIKAYEMIKHEK